ncbi:hypothetical protein [Phenylobacterium immobile]|uniref:hypothetical protein n=1 Tax=Phenylobacterium immobile TaxID=21 RepID=UPI000AC2A388|nr:hypothetical protein [Phenylobacterium immobile]
MTLLAYIGDAFWIIALAWMAGAARDASRKLEADVKFPLLYRKGQPVQRTSKGWALSAYPMMALGFSLILMVESRRPDLSVNGAWLLFGARMAAAPLALRLHRVWLNGAMDMLKAEGAVKS